MSVFIRNVDDILQTLPLSDNKELEELSSLYDKVLSYTQDYKEENKPQLIDLYINIGDKLRIISEKEERFHVFSFSQPRETHGRVSRLISKLRDKNTNNIEFTYYMQRAFEDLFNFGFQENIQHQKNYFEIATPVNVPAQNYAIHKLPNLDEQLHNSVMCVMLRGALLPSMIMAKEIEEYSSIGYVPDFALFRIARNDNKNADNMEYIIKEDASYFEAETLNDKDLIFPDPMNATGGSILTVLEYLKEKGIKPRSIKLFHAITSLKGAFQILRSGHNVDLYTLWVDPVLNDKAYIMPGLGDAGDRLNGIDNPEAPRNILQLIAYYGQNITQLYRAQIHKIEETILGKME